MSWRDKLSEADRQRIHEAVQPFRENPDYQQAATQGKSYDAGQTSEFDGNLSDPNHPAGQYQHDERERKAAQPEVAPAEPQPSAAQLEAEQTRDMAEIDAAKSPEQVKQERADYENGMSAQYEAEQAEAPAITEPEPEATAEIKEPQAEAAEVQEPEAPEAEIEEPDAPVPEVSEPEAEPQQMEMELGDDD